MTVNIEQYIPVVKHEGLNSAKTGILSGVLSFTGANTHTGIETHTGAETHTGVESFESITHKKPVTNTGGVYATPIVLTAAQSGGVILVNDAAGLDFTLPAIAAAQVGTSFDFLITITVTSNNFRVTAATGDILFGGIWMADFDTANTGAYFTPNGTSNLLTTMNGSTTGGKKGTALRYTALSATAWFVQGQVFGDGTLATPFS